MRRAYALALGSVLFLLSPGCSSQHGPTAAADLGMLTIPTSLGELTVEPPATDSVHHRRTVSVHLRSDESPTSFLLSFERDPVGLPEGTKLARILDPQGRLLWEYRIRAWHDGKSHLEIIERTEEEALRIHLSETALGTEERYELDGRTVAFRPGGSDSERASRFRAFYGQPRTLDDNPYGLLLTETLASAEFREWIQPENGDIMPSTLDPGVEEACKWAERALVKCSFGGWMNPLCHAAVGTTIACWIADAAES